MMVQQIRPEQLASKMKAGEPVYLLDVRQPEEHDYCHLPNSVLIPLPELIARVGELEPPPDTLIVVYCHHGVRSLSGAAIVQRAGHENVASLSGGIEEWAVRIDPKMPRY
jgi:adenylyltransferase/sulfurtransferase